MFFVFYKYILSLHKCILSLHEYISSVNNSLKSVNAYVDFLKEVLDIQEKQIKSLIEGVELNSDQILKILDLPDEKKNS